MSLKITSNTINYNVATVEYLATIANPSINDTVVVTDENRGGVFIYRSTGVANGGTIFDSSSTGKWYRQYDGAVNVKWFGAVGDGVTDDTAVIQKCLDFLGLQNGDKTLYVPKNIKWNINSLTNIPNNVNIKYYRHNLTSDTYQYTIFSNMYNSTKNIRVNEQYFESGYHSGSVILNNYNISGIYEVNGAEVSTISKKFKGLYLGAIKEGGTFPYTQWGFRARGANTSVAVGQSAFEEGSLDLYRGSPVLTINYTSQTMNFHQGLYVIGLTSGATGLIIYDTAGSQLLVDYISSSGTFVAGEVIQEILPTGNPLGYSQGSATISGTPAVSTNDGYDIEILNSNAPYKNNFCKINVLRDINFGYRYWINNRPSHTLATSTIYVNTSTGNDTNIGSSTYPLKTWAGVLKRLPNKINHNTTVNITGTLSDNMEIVDTTVGNATLTITGGTAPLINVMASHGSIIISTASVGAVSVINSQGITISSSSSLVGGVAFVFTNSIATCSGCAITGSPVYAVLASNSRLYSDSWVSGGGSSNGLRAEKASTIGKNGTQPTGAEAAVTGSVIR